MRKIFTIMASLAMLTALTGSASAQTKTVRPGCTNPVVMRGGFVELKCFPEVPRNAYPTGQQCEHEDYFAQGTKTITVDGQKYSVTQKIREDITVCHA